MSARVQVRDLAIRRLGPTMGAMSSSSPPALGGCASIAHLPPLPPLSLARLRCVPPRCAPLRCVPLRWLLWLGVIAPLAISCGNSYEGVARDQPPLVAPSGTWTWIDVPESRCNDGTPTGFAINPQDTSDLFVFFEGGGACWDYTTCVALNTATSGPVGSAEWALREPNLPAPFDRNRASNPFRNATMVYIPYCTGDLHAGDNVAQYQNVTYYHKGRPDTVAFMSRIASTWPHPARVVWSGSSAGGYGATLSYDLARKTFGDVRMYLIDDAGPLLEGDTVPAAEKTQWIDAWNIGDLTDALCATCRTDLSGVYTTLTRRYPNDRMALLSSLQDMTIRSYFMLSPTQFQDGLLQMVADRLDTTGAARPFLIAGDQHTLLGTMTTSETQNVVLETWLDDMISDRVSWVAIKP
jgi:Pectinacetylesterase